MSIELMKASIINLRKVYLFLFFLQDEIHDFF